VRPPAVEGAENVPGPLGTDLPPRHGPPPRMAACGAGRRCTGRGYEPDCELEGTRRGIPYLLESHPAPTTVDRVMAPARWDHAQPAGERADRSGAVSVRSRCGRC
jgi:hypothetical protein